jgi:hypothetical protein
MYDTFMSAMPSYCNQLFMSELCFSPVIFITFRERWVRAAVASSSVNIKTLKYEAFLRQIWRGLWMLTIFQQLPGWRSNLNMQQYLRACADDISCKHDCYFGHYPLLFLMTGNAFVCLYPSRFSPRHFLAFRLFLVDCLMGLNPIDITSIFTAED